MADEAEPTPDLEEEFDLTFLDKVLEYSQGLITVMPMKEFKEHWAERFFSSEQHIQQDALTQWEFKVAFGRNRPVFLSNDKGENEWIFPPLQSEIEAGSSGQHDSFYSKTMEINSVRNRLNAQGERMSHDFFSRKNPKVIGKETWDRRLHAIRMHCGIPYPGVPLSQDKMNILPGQSVLKEVDDDYDF